MRTILPPIHTAPILFVSFTKEGSGDLATFVKDRFEESGVIVFEEKDAHGNALLGLTIHQTLLEKEAERCGVIKPSTFQAHKTSRTLSAFEGTTNMRPFEIANKKAFVRIDSSNPKNARSDNTAELEPSYDLEGLFSSSDRVKILFSTIESLLVLPPGSDNSSNLVRKLNETIQIPADQIETEYRNMYLCNTLREYEFVEMIAPIHQNNINDKICKEALNPRSPFPLEALRAYYGEEIAFYFAWLQFYTKALAVPGLMGLITYILRVAYFQDSVDTCRLTPFHGLLTFLWGSVYTKVWRRRESSLAYEWGTFSSDGLAEKEISMFSRRHEFQGELRTSPVSGQKEKYYPDYYRRVKYVGSALVTIVLLFGAFLVMILSLNMQGFIKYEHEGPVGGRHPFHVPRFAAFADEGAIFDSTSAWRPYIPVLLHVILTLSMNMTYSKVAEILTKWENHETQLSYNNSMIVKRFCFEATDCYLALFYLAFYERDVIKVRTELVNVFQVDTLRRLALEGLLPFILQKLKTRKSSKDAGISKKTDSTKDAYSSRMQEDLNKDEYEQFDDYIEMIIQFGYITLFASAYPLAPLVAMAANFIEMRLDAFKLTYVCMRPRSVPTGDIGHWRALTKIILTISAFTNCCIFCFSSMQMVQFLPQYFHIDEEGKHELKNGSGWIVVFIVFGIERVLLILSKIIDMAFPDIPNDVKIREQRKQFIDMRIFQETRSNTKKD